LAQPASHRQSSSARKWFRSGVIGYAHEYGAAKPTE
jgi:hypothetical protein